MSVKRGERANVACGAGLVVLDLLVSDEAEAVRAYAGGTCGNVLAILAYLGWRACPIARIGDDFVGDKLRRDLRRCGVSEDLLVTDPAVSTPVIIQQNRRLPNGEISHRFVWRQCLQCGEFIQPFRPPTRKLADGLLDRLDHLSVFFFDRVSPATVALAEASAARDAIVVFEPSTPGTDRLFDRALRASDIVKYAKDRISTLHRPRDWAPWIEIQTMGRAGLRYRLAGKHWGQPLKAIELDERARDTSGAGDWTTAGVIDQLLSSGIEKGTSETEPIRSALRQGQALATINCAYDGARGAMYALTARQIRDRAQHLVRGESITINVTHTGGALEPDRYARVFCSSCAGGVAVSEKLGV